MPRIFDFGGRDVERTVTVASLKALKRSTARFAQVTAETAEEAAAAEAAGIEMVVCRATNVPRVREGSTTVFVTAALGFADAVTDDEMLRTAFRALNAGADAVITGRRPQSVRRLADEDVPVMGHLGFVPRKSTWLGSVRAVGKTAGEAMALWDRFRRLEDAGAVGVECELIPAQVMQEINRRTGLVTVSLGSGSEANVIFLFTSDICGEGSRSPRHAGAYGNLAALQARIRKERVKALAAFRADVAASKFPSEGKIAKIDSRELALFIHRLGDGEPPEHG